MTTGKRHSNSELLRFFQSGLTGLSSESALKYRRTISELECFLTAHRLELADLDPAMTADWAAWLLRQGLSNATVARHLNILSALVSRAADRELLEPCDAPRDLARRLADDKHPLPPLMREDVFDRCLTLLRESLRPGDGRRVAADMLLCSLLRGAEPFAALSRLTKGDALQIADEPLRSLLDYNITPKRRFVFDLRQSYLTPAQIYKELAKSLTELFRPITGLTAVDPDTLSASLWVACAIRCGATATEALRLLGRPAPYALPSFIKDITGTAAEGAGAPSSSEGASPDAADSLAEGEASPEAEPEALDASQPSAAPWRRAVVALLAQGMPRWFAMHIRKGVDFADLRRDIAEAVHPAPELYYPCETIRRRLGKRTVVEDHPFIASTAFFRTRQELIMPMFHAIGDKAWCYRLSNSPGSPYAVIPQADMKRFQAAVGIFTPDIELHPIGELTPRPGEKVIIVSAGYSGREAEVEEVMESGSGSILYRVRLTTDQGYEWRVDLDPRQLELSPQS